MEFVCSVYLLPIVLGNTVIITIAYLVYRMTNAPDLTKDQYVLLLSMEAHVSSVSQHQIVRLIHQVMSAIQAPIPVYNVQVPLIVQLMVMDTLAA